MPRKRRTDDEQARKSIIDTAREIFARSGFHNTTMDEIADGAKLSKPFLYRYFKSKDDLYLSVVENCTEQFLDKALTPLRAGDLTSYERTEQTIRVLTELVVTQPDAYKLLFESDMLKWPDVAQRVNSLRDGLVDTLTDVLREESRFTDLASCRLCAHAIMSAVLEAVKIIGAAETEEEQTKLSEVLIRFAWGGVLNMDEHLK
ncbi:MULTISPECIES: TetR/AcrR family transcriptional regulator [Kocuria]|uniref:TetR/AcrR family transcriptional regulator n=1 Tax=Kocuria TaxID=57493 RepID=UPI00065FE1D5|nr:MULTISPECIES: TetR/AcrR family transcriptional regulator [Kocuria]MCT1367027.1 TetR/AcrR family transcriptional regulator [Rothia sp. p3-SID1597]RUQ21732.1 TetR/AcrR family transcriptional regulator [Kocuria sp. HSID16901]